MKIEFSEKAKKQLEAMSEKDRAEIEKVLKSLERNPYQGTSCVSGPVGWYLTLKMKAKWLKREIELLFKK